MLRMPAMSRRRAHLDGQVRARLPRRLLSLQLALHHRAPVLHQEAAPKQFAPTREESLDTPDTDVAQHLADPTPNPEQTAANRELRPLSRTPSTGWNPLSARCWCCATSKGYRRQKWPGSWA